MTHHISLVPFHSSFLSRSLTLSSVSSFHYSSIGNRHSPLVIRLINRQTSFDTGHFAIRLSSIPNAKIVTANDAAICTHHMSTYPQGAGFDSLTFVFGSLHLL